MKIAFILLLCATLLITVRDSRAQNSDAVRVLNSGLQALGGEAKIKSLKSIYFSAKGTENGASAAQAYDPGKEAPTAHEEKLAVFNDGVRLAYELKRTGATAPPAGEDSCLPIRGASWRISGPSRYMLRL
jgi:hypothetical protein